MPKPIIETLLKNGSKEWNNLRKDGKVPLDHTGATFGQLFSANADFSGLILIGSEWEKCDLSKINFRETDLSNAYFHGGRLQDCDFRGSNLEGATFEKLKLLRCDFTGCTGLDGLELEDVDMDRVVGLNGEEAPPPPPPPAIGITSFTREQRTAALAAMSPPESDLPPFRPHDPPGTLLFRGLKNVGNPPLWVLDVPGLRPPLPARMMPGSSYESLYREAVKTRMENRRPVGDNQVIEKAKQVVVSGGADVATAVMYLREVGVEPAPSEAAVQALVTALLAEVEIEDLTASVDPRLTGALLELKSYNEPLEHIGEFRSRLAATTLFTSLLEAGFTPENNWEEALDSQESALDLAHQATQGNRELLKDAFISFCGLPEEVRLKRLAYLAEATAHVEAMIGGGAAVTA